MNEVKTSKISPDLKKKLWPLILSVLVIIADQVTKALVVKYIPLLNGFNYQDGMIVPVIGDFFRLIHVRNIAVAFSIGHTLSHTLRSVLFSVIPLVVIVLVYVIYFRNNEFSQLQRWSICGILGGGIGNIIDRIFRPAGVVDFLDVKFYGIFGMDRWPTFNVADMAVVICGILFVISSIVLISRESKAQKK